MFRRFSNYIQRVKGIHENPFWVTSRSRAARASALKTLWRGYAGYALLLMLPLGIFTNYMVEANGLSSDNDRMNLAVALAAAGGGVLARVAGRLIEIARTQALMEDWCGAIRPEARFMDPLALPRDGSGEGLVEAARGALGHWIRIEGGRIASYQIVAPTTWNFSPRDAAGLPGPVEAALVGAPVGADEDTPLSVQHIVRSFDPCMVCTVH